MREVVYSAATLAGFIGLACLYQNGQVSQRMKRETGFSAIQDNDSFFNQTEAVESPDMDFLRALGWLDNGADVPEEFIEDVKFYQDPKAGNARKQIQFIVKCLKTEACKDRAEATVSAWGKNNRRYIEGNIGVLLRPVAIQERIDTNNNVGICTPRDDVWACSQDDTASEHGQDPAATTWVDSPNDSPSTTLTTHADTVGMIAAAESDNLDFVDSNTNISGASDPNNVFGSGVGGVKIILVIPNGIPVTMPESYQANFGNYWGWFKEFNANYIGITKTGTENRMNFHFWFIRQDKSSKLVMKNAAKANKRFPWNRFDSLMSRVQSTAVQPKLKGTFADIWKEVDNKGFSSEGNMGVDCIVLWFHHYIPQDMLELADSTTQDDVIKPLDLACNIIHFWVGFNDMGSNSMSESRDVIKYIQGLLQPSQVTWTTHDHLLRGYHWVSSMSALAGDEGTKLASRVYNDIALDRKRVKCLIATNGKDMATRIDFYNEALAAKESDYSFYYDGEVTATTDPVSEYVMPEAYAYEGDDIEYGFEATTPWPETEAEEVPNDFMCCGRGFSGKKYNANSHECCEGDMPGDHRPKSFSEGCIDI